MSETSSSNLEAWKTAPSKSDTGKITQHLARSNALQRSNVKVKLKVSLLLTELMSPMAYPWMGGSRYMQEGISIGLVWSTIAGSSYMGILTFDL